MAYVGLHHNLKDLKSIPAAAILCTGGPDVIRKEAWSFYRTISVVRICWELEEPKGPKGQSLLLDPLSPPYPSVATYFVTKELRFPPLI